MILIDSSAWISFFNTKSSTVEATIIKLIEINQAAICGIVEMELLSGINPTKEEKVTDLLSALPYIETTKENYKAAGINQNKLRKKGIAIPSTDTLIATLCMENNLSILTLDKHFQHFTKLKKLQTT